MRRLPALVLASALLVPLAACGGDDGDDEASSGSASARASASGTEEDEGGDVESFCEGVEEVADSDFGELIDSDDPDDIAEAAELVEGLEDDVPEEVAEEYESIMEDFPTLVELVEEVADGADEEEVFTENEEFLTEFGENAEALDAFTLEECGVTVSGETEADGAEFEETGDSIGDGGASGAELGDPSSPPEATEDGLLTENITVEELDDLLADCEDGDFAACDEAFANTSVGSPEEDYASTCGGRLDLEDEVNGDCEAQFG